MRASVIARWLGYVLATAPVWYVPWTLFPAVFGKMPLVLPLIAFFGILALSGPRQPRQPRQPLSWAILAFGAAAALAAALGVDPAQSAWGSVARGTGLVVLAAYGVWYWGARRALDAEGWRRFLAVAVAAAVVEAAIVLVQAATGAAAGEEIRASGLFGNPTYVAGYLAIAVFLCASVATGGSRMRKTIAALAAATMALALVLTGARGGLVALVGGAACAVVAYATLAGGRTRRFALGASGVGLAALVALSLIPPDSWAALGAPAAVGRTLYWRNYLGDVPRLIQWGIAWEGFLERPFTGWGPETYQAVFDAKYSPELLRYSFSETVSDKPHNLLLELLVAGGAALGAAFVAVLVTALLALRRAARSGAVRPMEAAAAVGGMAAFVLHGMFLFETFPAAFLFVSILAWLASRASQGLTAPGPRPIAVWATRIALAGFTVLAFVAGPLAVRAQYAALLTLEAKTTHEWTSRARAAFSAPTVYHREIVKQIARDFLNKSAGAPEAFVVDTLPLVRDQVVAAAAAHPRDFTLRFMEGQLWGLSGNLQPTAEEIGKAMDALRSAEALSPRRQAVRFQIAKTQLLAGNAEEAIATLRAVVADDDTLQEPHWFLALALVAAGQRDEGAQEIARALELGRLAAMESVRNVKEMLYSIDVLAAAGRFEAIVPVYQALIRIEPDDADWHARLAATYERLGRPELAAIEAQRAAEIEPSFRDAADAFLRRLEDAAP